ncbi:MAG TPA: MFS transporter [Lysobacter sp.]|jgi:MFS family permease|nr:MFS transporter [Lysobacter sp.]
MPAHLRQAIWLLGLCQCVLWGVLYYSFSVLLVPMENSLGLSRTAVAGAFSMGLLAMAVMAPIIGRWLDAGHATRVTRIGVTLAFAGLLLVAMAHGAIVLYAGWLCIGISMAMLLYEPAFALVIRAVAEENQRLRALAAVTVLGGLASTVFLPAVSALIAGWNWRAAVLVCAGAVVLAAWTMERHVVPALPAIGSPSPRARVASESWPPHFAALVAIFASGTLASMALTTLLIPLLVDRGASPAVAAAVLAALGVAQLPGRIWLLRGRREVPARALNLSPIVLQVTGLAVIVLATSPWWVATGVAVFGLGAGLQTLARPWLVQALYGVSDAGRWNGEVARIQGFARAAGPVAAAGAAWVGGTPVVLAGVGGLLVLTLPLARRLPL